MRCKGIRKRAKKVTFSYLRRVLSEPPNRKVQKICKLNADPAQGFFSTSSDKMRAKLSEENVGKGVGKGDRPRGKGNDPLRGILSLGEKVNL